MSNQFKVKFNGKTLCVFATINDKELGNIIVHIANIDTMANRIYTTFDGYHMLATPDFQASHTMLKFDEEEANTNDIIKFNVCVDYTAEELTRIIKMCSRYFSF